MCTYSLYINHNTLQGAIKHNLIVLTLSEWYISKVTCKTKMRPQNSEIYFELI